MSKLTRNDFKGISMKDINNYIETINEYLNERIPKGGNWSGAVKNLSTYLNQHDFLSHEGVEINDDTIDEFITRINNENNNNNLNFLPSNKLVQPMSQPQLQPQPQPQPVNPLEQLVGNTITVQDLLNIYNQYAPNMLSMEQIQQLYNNPNAAKAYLIEQILSHARDGTLVSRGNLGGPQERKGMIDLAKIVLDLQRDVTRVKNAISPQGAEQLVIKHNATAKPSAHWKLNKRNPQAPASLTNLTDINNDGIPDVIITNANNQPIYVNGYTTKASRYPVDLAYYNQYPTRESRSGHSYNDFKNELFNVQYDDNNEDFSKRGNVASYTINQDYIAGYDPNKYQPPKVKRMSSFARFKKFIATEFIDNALAQLQTPSTAKLAQSSKGASAAWNHFILEPLFTRYGAVTTQQQARIKKKAADEIDNMVNELYYKLHNTGDNWTEEQRAALNEEFKNVLLEAMGNFVE